jgi:hypothetical protein
MPLLIFKLIVNDRSDISSKVEQKEHLKIKCRVMIVNSRVSKKNPIHSMLIDSSFDIGDSESES